MPTRTTIRNFSANETEIDQLLHENASWKNQISDSNVEISFLNHFLNSDVFEEETSELNLNLESYINQLENFRTNSLDLAMEIHNHRYDIEGMLECEDIGCERFYHDEHVKLESGVKSFLKNFKAFKLELYTYTGPLLKKKY